MKTVLSALVISSFIAAPAFAIEPIKGSINFDGPSQESLSKTPVGSVLKHQFTSNGNDYVEIYVVGADGHPELVSRTASNNS
ncbi:hypothetical protein ACFPOD_17445 [Nitratireductor kimnyeongensis]|uniref:Uncharacterized protein n=1 Tax=Nitratireductor kimnyeongensis TaxID=430679 RepID=A0ABW0TC90_9HYPH|nr:hypothetical protein [Nitratireductor kimnyeongensis]QZZ36895.1 hypothetical protein KW403_07155 [Nitratireductor kimnyeongensis]